MADETVSRTEAVAGRLTSREAVRHAYEFVNDGNYRAAVRQLYLAALLLLDERGQLFFDSSRTDHEYLRSVLANRGLYDSLGPIIETFEDTWYGMEPITPQEFEAYRRRVEAVGIA